MSPPIHDREQAIEKLHKEIPQLALWVLPKIVDALGIGTTDHEEASLRAELATLLGSRKPREGVTQNDQWIAAVGELLMRAERAEERLREVEGALRYLADDDNWLGNPHDQQATLHGHDTPYELARAVLSVGQEQDKP